MPPKEALLCGKELQFFVLQFNSPRNGLDLGEFQSPPVMPSKISLLSVVLRGSSSCTVSPPDDRSGLPDKNTGVFRKPCKGSGSVPERNTNRRDLVRPYDDLFAEKFFPGEILGDTQKVVFRPIDLADRGNFCFRIKRRQKGPVARRQSKACELSSRARETDYFSSVSSAASGPSP